MARAHIEAIHYTAAPLEDGTGKFEGALWHILSRDEDDQGAMTTVTRLPRGFQTSPAQDRSCELFVLNGEVRVDGKTVPLGHYAYIPNGHSAIVLESPEPSMLYLWFGDAGAGGGELGIVDPDTIPWGMSVDDEVPQSSEGRVVNITKRLRHDPVSGDLVGMSVMYSGHNQDCAESHQASDEGFMLRGDMLALDPRGNPTELVVGSYNWRPSDVRHLPKYSYHGNLRLFRTQRGGWDDNMQYYSEPRWPEMVEQYKSKQRFF